MNRLRSALLILVVMIIASLLIACGTSAAPATATPVPTENPADAVPRITVEELKDLIDKETGFVLIDTQLPGAFDNKHLPGAIEVPESYDAYSHETMIVLYCS